MQRVIRPQGGINDWLHWLPVSVHQQIYYILRRICGTSRFGVVLGGRRLSPIPYDTSISAGLASVLDADAKRIATMARETFEKYVSAISMNVTPLPFSHFLVLIFVLWWALSANCLK